LYAYNTAVRLSKKVALFQCGLSTQHNREVTKIKLAVAKAVRRYQSRYPLLKPLSAVKAARRCQGHPPLLKPLAIVKAARRC
jgi:hypothetical protein